MKEIHLLIYKHWLERQSKCSLETEPLLHPQPTCWPRHVSSDTAPSPTFLRCRGWQGECLQPYPAALLKLDSADGGSATLLPAGAGEHRHTGKALSCCPAEAPGHLQKSSSCCLAEANECASPVTPCSYLAKASGRVQSTQGRSSDHLAWWPRGLAFLSFMGL